MKRLTFSLFVLVIFVITNNTFGNLNYSTYLGGSSWDDAYDIAVDNDGNVYITGQTASSNFPIKNPYQGSHGGGLYDAFVAKFSKDGSLIYSTYLGGNADDWGWGIAVDNSGNVYVTGCTRSSNFPIQNPYQGSYGGGGNWDVFVTKFSCIGSTLIYSTYLGGNSNEHGYGITVDNDGNAYITGVTSSSDFPTRNPYQSSFGGLPGWHTDAFVTEFSNNGELLYSTFLGGSDLDYGQGIAVDDSGQFYVAGYTYSSDFPTQNPYQHSFGGGDTDAFISKFSANGSALVYSTYLGGNDNDRGYGIALKLPTLTDSSPTDS